VEQILRRGLEGAKTTSLKAAWFGALRSTATTAETVGWLRRIWQRDEQIAGLPLAEPDEADLALELAVRDVADADEVLETQLARFTNPDRRARFAFVMPAVSGERAARDAFFDGLRQLENRRQEEWVLEAVRYLHHPLRAHVSAAYVRPALELVRELQRTGDIFFPKRWTDNTLAGYRSPEVAAAVREFIEGLPADYPARLRWVLLASADPLFRAANLG
jgi:aminopeptidase N